MKRIAYCSPLNPVSSGISDYSEELLPYLAQYFAIDLFVDDGLRPSHAQLAQHFEILPLRRLEALHRRKPYAALIYQMGNSPAHQSIYTLLQRLPGILVLHDYVLHHFMLGYAAMVLRDIRRYTAEMARRYGEEGAAVARIMAAGRLSDAAFDFPLAEPALEAAQGLIAHSRLIIEHARAVRPDLPAAQVPMGVPLPALRDRDAARQRLRLPPTALVLASFGHINPYKRLEPALRAFRELLHDYPGAQYLLVGSASANYDLAGLLSRMGLSAYVRITGHVPRQQFEDYVAATDICLNLRFPSAGETSASLLRLLGAGRPTLVSATGTFVELPAGVAAQVDPGPAEGDLILAYCRLLAARPDLAAMLGAVAREYVAREHTLERAAAGYAAFLARCYGWNTPLPQRPPLWDPAPIAQPAALLAPRDPPAAPLPATAHALLPCASQALSELGLSDADPLLHELARRIAELG